MQTLDNSSKSQTDSEISACETTAVCSSDILSGLGRSEQNERRDNLRWRRKKPARIKAGACAAAICTFRDTPLPVSGNIRSVCLDYRRTGRYQIHIRCISTYKGGLIPV